MTLSLHLKNSQATVRLGREMAKIFAQTANPPALLLQGALGSGKTTLVRGFVESLPGSEMAEVSSPSFNIFNCYPTVPPVAHFDLYRLEGMPPDDSLFECLDDAETITVVEWIQFLDPEMWPEDAVLMEWTPSDTGRSLTLRAFGRAAEDIVDALRSETESEQI